MLPAFFSLKKVTAKMPVSNISPDMEELLLQVCKIIKKAEPAKVSRAKPRLTLNILTFSDGCTNEILNKGG